LKPATAQQDAAESEAEGVARELAALRQEVRLLRMANAELERVAVRDTLTPLYNRRYFLTALNERILRRGRYGAQAAVLFADIDGLKQINDQHGHGAGDFALIHAANVLAAHVRATDVVARIGGDEFAFILEETDAAYARAKAIQLAETLAQSLCRYDGAVLAVGASIGLTVLMDGDSDEAIMARADADMYAAKRARRA
jgi:diguanylate cyclase (GGDEF)-like protein